MTESTQQPDSNSPFPDKVDLASRLEYLTLTNDDGVRLRSMLPDLDSVADEFVESFYAHLTSFELSGRFLRDEDLVRRLKEYQREHLRTMLQAKWDEEYVAKRGQVGYTHAARGVEPHLFLGAFYQFVEFGLRRLCRTDDGDPDQAAGALALLKAVFLDIGLTLDAYFQQSTRDLEQALDMVWKSNAELRQFAQLTSHDLKTPLATVSNLCEELLDEYGDDLPGDSGELVRSAQRTALRMSTMIDDLLSTAATVHSAGEAATTPLDTDEILSEVLERVQPLLKRNQVDVTVTWGLPGVVGHKSLLREVFYNLISNAAKYIDKRPGRIEVSAEVRGPMSVFSVADNGPGIPMEDLERVFAPFRRLARHDNVEGTGLGLYFAKNLIEKQGGRIWVESKEGAGSCFFVSIRRHVQDQA